MDCSKCWDLVRERDHLRLQLNQLEKHLKLVNENLKANHLMAEKTNSELLTENEELLSRLRSSERTSTKLSDQVRSQAELIDKLAEQVEDLNREKAIDRKCNLELSKAERDEKSRILRDHDEIHKRLTLVIADKKSLSIKVDRMERLVKEKELENGGLQDQVDQLSNNFKENRLASDDQLQELQSKEFQLTSEVRTLTSTNSRLQKKLEKCEREVTRAKAMSTKWYNCNREKIKKMNRLKERMKISAAKKLAAKLRLANLELQKERREKKAMNFIFLDQQLQTRKDGLLLPSSSVKKKNPNFDKFQALRTKIKTQLEN